MRYEEIIRYVERVAAGGLSWEGAERAATATLATLAECLPRGEAHDLAEQLPTQLGVPLERGPAHPETLTVDQSARR
jgi:uncharacterized protein (DUF2267 family)